ncbi:hypothetical protein ACIHCQ_32605 [Streptomyces sp. NPDC052236]|uniref:hypothetical protein n=1 Tax=Streptomyces sp. NPDC052236 TaxID=3365686 RepID=UPI0037CCD9E4
MTQILRTGARRRRGSLEIEPGLVRADSDELLHESLDALGLPREYAAAVRGHRDALDALRTSNRLWTYFSPAEDIAPGERTGRFRIGGDQHAAVASADQWGAARRRAGTDRVLTRTRSGSPGEAQVHITMVVSAVDTTEGLLIAAPADRHHRPVVSAGRKTRRAPWESAMTSQGSANR